jgi:hypothetical protein
LYVQMVQSLWSTVRAFSGLMGFKGVFGYAVPKV